MDPLNQNTQPAMNPQPATSPVSSIGTSEKKTSVGSIVGIVIIVVILIFGGLYFWGAQLEKEQMMQDELPFILGDDETGELPTTSGSDEVSALEQDIDTTNMDAIEAQLDTDLGNIENQM